MSDNTEQRAWHEIDDEYAAITGCTVHGVLFNHCRAVEEDQIGVHSMNILNTRLYSNREPMMFEWTGELGSSFRPLTKNYENLVQYTVDTIAARLVQPIKLAVYTRGAEFDVYLRGRQLDKYLWGEFQALGITRKVRRMFLDALVSGTGVLKIGVRGDGICVERVNPDEIIVDNRECLNDTEPASLMHRRLVPRNVLRRMYPKHVEHINSAQGRNFQYTSWRSPSEEQIVVVEAWYKGGYHGGNGMHAVVIENCTLSCEAWSEDDFPYVFLRWADPIQGGFYGRPAVSDMIGYQIRHNELNEDIAMGQRMMCVPRVFIEQGSAITGTKLDDKIGGQVFYRGTKPEAETWAAFNPEIYNERDRNKAACLEHFGLNPAMTSGKMPSQTRFDSSEALNTYNTMNDDRFSDKLAEIEAAYVRIGLKMIAAAKELYSRKVNRKSTYRSGQLVEQIDWESVDMPADKYILQVAAASVTSMSPAARKDKLNTWLDKGLITPPQYMASSGEPDLEKMTQRAAAPTEHIEFMISAMMRGEPQVPDPHDNLAEGLVMVTSAYLHLRTLDTDESVLDLFLDWIVLAENELNPEPADEGMPAAPPMPESMVPPVDPMMAGPPGAAGPAGPAGAMNMPPVGPPMAAVPPIPNGVI